MSGAFGPTQWVIGPPCSPYCSSIFNKLREPAAGAPFALPSPMTPTQLLYLSRELELGRPLWSLLRANEWMVQAHPIRREIARQACALLKHKLPNSILEPLRAGATLGSFSEEIQRQLRHYKERPRRMHMQFSSSETFARTFMQRREMRRGGNARVAAGYEHYLTHR